MVTDEICDMYTSQTGTRIERNYASSGTLARQIANGANADIFVSANGQWVNYLRDKKMLKPESIRVVAGNSLAVIAPRDAKPGAVEFTPEFDFAAAANHIAVGDPAYVPVGRYTDEVFGRLKWKDRLGGNLVLAKDVSSVLNYVAMGECELGVVYRSEAMSSSRVKIVAEVPTSLHSPIKFFMAETTQTAAPKLTRALAGMFSTRGADVFKKFGFSLPLAQ